MESEGKEIDTVYNEFLLKLAELRQKQDGLMDEFFKVVEQERIAEIKAHLETL